MKDGLRFVDCDMHIMEPTDLFDKYLDPAFRQRVTSSPRPTNSGSTGMRRRPLWFFDGAPIKKGKWYFERVENITGKRFDHLDPAFGTMMKLGVASAQRELYQKLAALL